ncbi:putative F-box protein At3g21120 [Ziziphus jujuba]|uniref:F-box protein At3g21120 n=1 Tax=Ziziphus jujuba TaxID=326968 RepID=A0A6P4API8_ZIZJJ|nr:putative F-box protein At3g21120 [Ziziphus jujuba]
MMGFSGESESFVNLAEDLVIEILLRLPGRSLMRFKSVCKSWNSIINSSSFIHKHFLIDRDPYIVLTSHGGKFGTRFLTYDHTLGAVDVGEKICGIDKKGSGGVPWDATELSPTQPRQGHLDNINKWLKLDCYSSCNGLIFVKYANMGNMAAWYKYALWNPATGESKEIPIFPDPPRFGYGYSDEEEDYPQDFGIGFDSKNNEYKPFYTCSDIELDVMVIKIYSFKTERWKIIECSGIISHGVLFEVVNSEAEGMSHWIGFSSLVDREVIVSFDINTELVQTTPFPDDIIATYTYTYSTYYPWIPSCPYPLRFNESLALVVTQLHSSFVVGKSFDIWVLGEYGNKDSWTKLFTIGPLSARIERVVGFWSQTKIFVSENNDKEVDGKEVKRTVFKYYDTVTKQALKLQPVEKYTNTRVLICRQSLFPIS